MPTLLSEADTGDYDIDAGHEIYLPGVICPTCGTWARTGVAYPTVTRKMLGSLLPRLNPGPLPLPEFQSLQRDVRELLGTTRPLFPGTHFDLTVGKLSGRVRDFAWSNPWTVFVERRAFEIIRDRGVLLAGAPAQLKARKGQRQELVELEAIPGVHLHESIVVQQGQKKCGLCGRLGIRKPDVIVLENASLDLSIPIQRVFELSSFVISEEFAEVIRSEQLQGANLTPVESA